MIKAVLFDLDETLFDRIASLQRFIAHQFKSDYGTFESAEALAHRFNALDDRNNVNKSEVYPQIFREMGHAAPDIWRGYFLDYEASFWRYAQPYAGMGQTLNALRRAGMALGIITNGETHMQQRSVLALGLHRMVDVVLISEDEGCRKPDPEIFLRAADKLDVDPRDCAFVGDTPQTDMIGARTAQMRTIWFPNGMTWPATYNWRPDHQITCLADVKELCRNVRFSNDDGDAIHRQRQITGR